MGTTSTNPTTTATNPLAVTSSAFSPSTTGQVVGQEQTLGNWAAPYITNMLGRTQALAQTPYQTYGGPLTAGASSLQNKFFGGLGSINFPSQLGKSFTDPGVAQSYMNPYMGAVNQQLQRQADTQRAALGPQNVQSAFGSRSGLANQQINAELMRQQQQAQAQAYGQAQQQFNTEQQQASGLAGMIGQAGAQQRDIRQQGIAADQAEFEKQRQWPYQQLQFQQAMLQGLPISATNYAYQQPSGFSKLLTGTGGLMELYKILFPNG